jgi:hypothetical protein
VIGWGWLQDDPEIEADHAVWYSRVYGLDGFIANAEDAYEGPANYWKSQAFVNAFRALAPYGPLALSYIGYGNPHRDMPFKPWVDAGAVLMPQCYWATAATSIEPSLWSADMAQIPRDRLAPTVGTSGFAQPYPASTYRSELDWFGMRSSNVWLLESTTDDTLRTLYS